MSIILDTADAKAAVATCNKAAWPGHPILGCIHLEATEGIVTFTGGGSDMAVAIAVERQGKGTGRALVPAKLLADVVGRCPGVSIAITIAEDHLALTSGRWKVRLPMAPAAEYDPWLIGEPDGDPVTFDGDDFLATVADVLLAASGDKSRPMLGGVHIGLDGDGLRLVATDSYRLSTRHLDQGGLEADAIVPAPALALLAANHLEGNKVDLWMTPKGGRFRTGNTTMTTTLVAGTFPTWRNLIPPTATGWLTVENPKALTDAVKRNGGLFGGEMGLITLTLTAEAVAMEAVAGDVGRGTEEHPVTWTGPDLTITFRSGFLAEALVNFGGAPVTAAIVDDLKPVIFRRAETPGSDDLHLLMPVRR